MSTGNERRERVPGVFIVKLTTLSIVLLCVTVSSLASLVVVTTITKADALSTVALALAVLAFAAQLIVTIAQAQSAAEQTRDTFRINAETKAVLAELQAQGSALVALQSSQFDKLLDKAINADLVGAALDKSTEGASGEEGEEPASVDLEVFASTLRMMLEQSVAERSTPEDRYPATSALGQEDGKQVVLQFQNLSTDAQELLMELVDRRGPKNPYTIREESPKFAAAQELHQAGLVRWRVSRPDGSTPLFLSMKGNLLKEILDPKNPVVWTRMLRKRVRAVNHARMLGPDTLPGMGDRGTD